MMSNAEISEWIMSTRRMGPEQMSKGGMLPRFVERDPMLGAVAERLDDDFGIIGKVIGHVAPGKAPAQILQGLRRVPMEKCDERQDAPLKQGIDEALIVIQSLLIDLPAPIRQDSAPGDGETIGVETKLGHQGEVPLWVGVGITGDIRILTGDDFARLVRESIPN